MKDNQYILGYGYGENNKGGYIWDFYNLQLLGDHKLKLTNYDGLHEYNKTKDDLERFDGNEEEFKSCPVFLTWKNKNC